MIWSIDRDTITETDPDGFAARTYRYSLDLGQSPGTIDLNVLNIGLTLHALYKLDGEDLTVCLGVERPRDFEDRPDGVSSESCSTGRVALRRNWPRSAPTLRVATGRSSRKGPSLGRRIAAGSI